MFKGSWISPLYPNPHKNLMKSVLSWDASALQVLLKSVLVFFLCDPADNQSNLQTNTGENRTSMVDVIIASFSTSAVSS